MIDLKRLSKTISFILRHNPASHGVIVDKDGWAEVNQMIFQIRQRNPQFMAAHVGDIKRIIETSDKKRFELKGSKIRAYYGHSKVNSGERKPVTPPDTLYQGTTPEAAEKITSDGIKKMSREYVHLSTDQATAKKVALRRTSSPILLEIDAKQAHADGVVFYLGNEDVWLTDYIAPEYVTPVPWENV